MKATTEGLTLRLFGQPTLLIGDSPAPPLRTRKGFWLLALLALRYGREVERSWLAGTLWAESDESQALYNLRRSLSDLRQVLGTEAECLLSPTPHTLRLIVGADAIDVVQFDAAIARGDSGSLDRAIALYSGRLLEGCTEEWALSEADARERAYLGALKTQAAHALETSNLDRAEMLARQVTAADFTEETAWRLLLTALARQGNSTALVAAYRDLRLRLLRDFNLTPDPQTTALYEQLRAESNARKLTRGRVFPVLPEPLTPVRIAALNSQGEHRKMLLKTPPQCSAEWMQDQALATELQQTHATYYAHFAKRIAAHLSCGRATSVWLDALEQEQDNLRRALTWYTQATQEAARQEGLQLVGSMLTFWRTRGYYTEGRRWMTMILEQTETLPFLSERALALNGLGEISAYQGDRRFAQMLHHQALKLYHECDDPCGIGETLNHLGSLARQLEQYPLAQTHFQSAREAIQGQAFPVLDALTLYNQGTVAYRTGRSHEAQHFYYQALREFDQQENRCLRVLPLLGIAHLARQTGRLKEAVCTLRAMLQGCMETGHIPYRVFALELAGQVARLRDEAEQAAQLAGAASRGRLSLGNPPTPAQQYELSILTQALTQTLGANRFASEYAAGQSFTLEQAFALAQQ